MKLTPDRVKKFQTFIFSWWKEHRRDLPWRHTHDPYKILVSEVMLQQTQAQRVIPKYAEFIKAYPTIESLSEASNADILRMWKGMGYNRRALYLKKITSIPKTEHELLMLPGIGKYTARAILVFAHKKDIAMVDTNIRQIITHFFFDDKPQKEKAIQSVADQFVPKGKSWEWHQALMDYGALEMQKIKKKDEKIKKSTIPFKESNRFFRGRIIDMLREKDMKELELIDECVRAFDRSEDFFVAIISGLEKDALIVRKNGIIAI